MSTSESTGSTGVASGDIAAAGSAELRLDEFPVPTPEEWRGEVERLLKGAPFEKKMRTRTPEGITLEPMYRSADIAGCAHLGSLPGYAPFVRGAEAARAAGWDVAQEIAIGDPAAAAKALREEIAGGATVAAMVLAGDGLPGLAAEGLRTALADVDLAAVSFHLRVPADPGPAIAELERIAAERGVDATALRGSVTGDPLGTRVRTGEPARPIEESFDGLAAAMRRAIDTMSGLAIVRADGVPFHDTGANAVQELGFAVASLIETIRALDARGVSVEDIAPRAGLRLAVGPRFLIEVAKLRASRLLVARVLETCGLSAGARRVVLHVRTSRISKTITDPHVNLLRATTEALSAIVGGADAVHVAPFDEPATTVGDSFSRRLARNTQIILRDEAHLGRVLDPGGGSWAIERVTAQLAEAAWKLVQEVEAIGGLAAALADGMPQRAIAATAAARAKDYATRKSVLVGTNKYANTGEEVTDDAAVPSISVGRFGEPFEALRRRVAALHATDGKARIFLATLGRTSRFMPRLDFMASFFETGGFEAPRNEGHESAEAAARAAVDSGASIVAIVGPDDAYPDGAPAVARAVKEARPDAVVLIAGRPGDDGLREALGAAGVDTFLHARADVLETLGALADRLEGAS